MTFLNAPLLALLLLIPIFVLFFLWRNIVRAMIVRRIGDAELVQKLLAQISPARRRWKQILWLLTLAALILAVARPVWGIELQKVEKQGVAIVVVVDVSLSMAAQDIVPARLDRARLDMQALLAALEGNDAAIILFAGQAFHYMPLTYDMQAAQVFIRSITLNAVPTPGTAIGEALDMALKILEDVEADKRVIVLLSDGENHEGSPLNAARTANEAGIIIHTLGYGTITGSTIPIYDDAGTLIDYKKDAAGNLVQTVLDEIVLRTLAEITGGIYQPIVDGTEIANVVNAIQALQPGDLGEEWIERPIEQFGIFVALALLALSIEILLPETRRERDS
jgi:Ca-activated chloride channel family protein